jgi:predicted metal-dependent phosphoesterase TrpH
MPLPKYLNADFHTHPLGDKYYYNPPHALSTNDQVNISRFLSAMANRGLQLLAITDHHSVESALWAREEAARRGYPFIVIPGAELVVLGASQRLHLLALNIKADLTQHRLTLRDASEQIRSQGGLPILAHPVKYPQEVYRNPGIFEELDGIETVNLSEGVFPVEHFLDRDSCYKGRYIQQTGGSDFHWIPESAAPIGLYHPVVPFRVPTEWLLKTGLIESFELEKIASGL